MTPPTSDYLNHLYAIVNARKGAVADASYVAALVAKGRAHIAKKLGEEGVETALAGALGDRDGIIHESADLLFHWLVLLADAGITPDDVFAEMRRREGTSGLTEKTARG